MIVHRNWHAPAHTEIGRLRTGAHGSRSFTIRCSGRSSRRTSSRAGELDRWNLLCWRANIVFPSLRSQRSLGLITMSLSLAILFVGILHRNLLVHKVLAVHIGNGRIGGLEVGEGDEAITLGQIVVIPSNLESKLAFVNTRFLIDQAQGTLTLGKMTRLPNRLNVS